MKAQKLFKNQNQLRLFALGFFVTLANVSGGARAGLDSTALVCPSCEAAAAAQALAQNPPLNTPGSNNTANISQMNNGISYSFNIGAENGLNVPLSQQTFYNIFKTPIPATLAPVAPTAIPGFTGFNDSNIVSQPSFKTNCSIAQGAVQYVVCPDSQGNVDAVLPDGTTSLPSTSVQSLLPALPTGPLI